MNDQISISVSVVGTGCDGTGNSVIFHVTKHGVYSNDESVVRRFMFNCGEGNQRLCGENGIKLGSLNSIFLTRLDPMSATGIPGTILALGTCGAPTLNVVGPRGTHSYLSSTASFAKRRYPQLHCLEIAGDTMPTIESHVSYKVIDSNAIAMALDDLYVRILPLRMQSHGTKHSPPLSCQLCEHPPVRKPKVNTPKPTLSKELDEFHNWLNVFFMAKAPSKVPYIEVIANRYKGREDELKRMLHEKYGSLDKVNDSDASSSDSDSASEIETCEQQDKSEDSSFEKWLENFYKKHNPAMLPRMASVQKSYAGREDHLKKMLEEKYGKRSREEINEDVSSKKAKHEDSGTESYEAFVTPTFNDTPLKDDISEIVFYILEFKHTNSSSIVWVVDLPSSSWISKLENELSSCSTHKPVFIVHMSSAQMLNNPLYTKWVLANSSTTTNHLFFDGSILSNCEHGRLGFNFKASAQHRLNLHSQAPTLFPLTPAFHSLSTSSQCHLKMKVDSICYTLAQARMSYIIHASKSYQVPNQFQYEVLNWEYPSIQASPPQPFSYPSIVFLGTGSAAPSKLRNSSAIYLEYSVNAGMLIDCGEGTFGQLWRQFGPLTSQKLRNLSCIWLSHKHADHHCGLLRILYERHQTHSQVPLLVIAPDDILNYVALWQQPWATKNVHYISCQEFNQVEDNPLRNNLFATTGFQALNSILVHHCHGSYGLVLVLGNGYKIVYSGDTRPCNRLVFNGLDADVLIHEATFEDEMLDDAIKKKHSTVGEAIAIGQKMQAKAILLTHFSQRYPSLPPKLQTTATSIVGFAFDGMHVQLSSRGFDNLERFMHLLNQTK
ncbi:zinc phosphodiesterase [Thraustotheca clavata]|uniref:ribonuclease Z n=1 Tax=Thraustotheca clavata TaxID=74557 RepID=A0A1V9YXH0_9STRA|nr:zinc phosphodiesterase [Thraustotheca clavata]